MSAAFRITLPDALDAASARTKSAKRFSGFERDRTQRFSSAD
jgi:hypothetical protein